MCSAWILGWENIRTKVFLKTPIADNNMNVLMGDGN
jgi:hypothetical protein